MQDIVVKISKYSVKQYYLPVNGKRRGVFKLYFYYFYLFYVQCVQSFNG
jgi:hypothetical protein